MNSKAKTSQQRIKQTNISQNLIYKCTQDQTCKTNAIANPVPYSGAKISLCFILILTEKYY